MTHRCSSPSPAAIPAAYSATRAQLVYAARWAAAPCVNALTRDVKRIMLRCETEEHSRRVPVLYAAADNAMHGWSA